MPTDRRERECKRASVSERERGALSVSVYLSMYSSLCLRDSLKDVDHSSVRSAGTDVWGVCSEADQYRSWRWDELVWKGLMEF